MDAAISFRESFGAMRRELRVSSSGRVDVVRMPRHGSAAASSESTSSGGGGGGGGRSYGLDGALQWLHTVFLPEGFPNSVGPDYVAYQTYDVAQALCSAVTGTLSTRAVLAGVGVGQQNASVVSGTLQWIIRDGTGMVGRIFFASRIASDLDNDMKRWRIAADVCNDVGILLEIGCSMAPREYFVPLVCTAALIKAVTAVAGQATRSTMAQHFARRDNMADISAKNASQETAVSFIGMFVGMAVAAFVPPTVFYNTLVYVIVTLVHITLNVRAVRCLVLRHFNQVRLDIALAIFSRPDFAEGSFPTPDVMRHLEGIVVQNPYEAFLPRPTASIELGASMVDAIRAVPAAAAAGFADACLRRLREERFANVYDPYKQKYRVVLAATATSVDILKAYVLAQLSATPKGAREDGAVLLQPSAADTERLERFLVLAKSKGWAVDRALFKVREWRTDV